MIRPRVVVHNLQHISAQDREYATLTAHEVGAHENLQSLDRVTASQPEDFVCRSRVIKETKAPRRQARNFGLLGLLAGGALAAFSLLPGLGVALAGGVIAGLNQSKVWSEPSSVASLGKGHSQYHHGEENSVSKGTPESASQFLEAGMKQYPQAQHVVMVSGHGSTAQVGDFSFKELAGELRKTQANSGHRPSLVMFKSCSVGQLENLSELVGTADAAVMSSVPIASMRYPLEAALHSSNFSGNGHQDALSVSKAIKRDSDKSWSDMEGLGLGFMGSHHTQAIDLHQLEKKTLPALDEVGECLQRELLAGHRDTIKRAAAKALVESPNNGGDKLRFDLRGTLENLKESSVSSTTKQKVHEALQHWPVSGESGELSISFHLAPQQDAIRKLSPRWCTFIDSFRSSLLKKE